MLDWNDLRSFLELARRGKLTMAGKRLNVEPTTVGRHINRLEKEPLSSARSIFSKEVPMILTP